MPRKFLTIVFHLLFFVCSTGVLPTRSSSLGVYSSEWKPYVAANLHFYTTLFACYMRCALLPTFSKYFASFFWFNFLLDTFLLLDWCRSAVCQCPSKRVTITCSCWSVYCRSAFCILLRASPSCPASHYFVLLLFLFLHFLGVHSCAGVSGG